MEIVIISGKKRGNQNADMSVNIWLHIDEFKMSLEMYREQEMQEKQAFTTMSIVKVLQRTAE